MAHTKSGPSWPAAWSARIGERLQQARKAAGMTAQQLAERCTTLGYPITRATIAGIETGRKRDLPVHEVAVFAAALGVSPVSLLYPLRDGATEVDVLPGTGRAPLVGMEWFSGRATLDGDPIAIQTDASEVSLVRTEEAAQRRVNTQMLTLQRARLDLDALRATRATASTADAAPRPGELDMMQAETAVRVLERDLNEALAELRDVRGWMRAIGVVPPPVNEAIRPVYESSGGDASTGSWAAERARLRVHPRLHPKVWNLDA